MSQLLKAFIALLFTTVTTLAEPITVLALGDSLTQGYGLTPKDGFVPQLQGWLRDHDQDVQVINAGVSGDTTAGGAARVAWSLTEDVDAVIVALGGNDILRGIPANLAKANLDSILTQIGGLNLPVLLVGQQATGNYGPAYRDAFNAIYPALAQSHDTALFPDFLAGLTTRNDLNTVMAQYMQPDGLHPNAAGVLLVVEAMGPAVTRLLSQIPLAQ